MPDCHTCSRPMRLIREPEGRAYQCLNCAQATSPMDPQLELDIESIRDDLALQRFVDASQVAAKQAWHRHLSAQLTDAYQTNPYLSQPEIECLKSSAQILEKLARAAELAKRDKEQQHLESEQHLKLRYKKALTELDCADLYDEDNVIDLALHLLTLSEVRADTLPALDIDRINWILGQSPSTGSVVFHLINHLRQIRQEQRSGIAYQIAARPEPIDDQMKQLRGQYRELRPSIRNKHYAVIDAIQNILSLDHRRWE